jgi:hypothetical protein
MPWGRPTFTDDRVSIAHASLQPNPGVADRIITIIVVADAIGR